MKLTPEYRNILKEAFFRAKYAAESVDCEDGGTCNLDSPAFTIKGVRETELQEIAASVGLRVSSFSWFGGRWFCLMGCTRGQGNLRAQCADAADKVLREIKDQIPGLRVCCYQQMD